MKYAGISDQYKASIHRRKDAGELRNRGRWRGAMYLLGYSVECALKVKLMERHRLLNLNQLQYFLRKRRAIGIDVFTHSLHELMEWTDSGHRMNMVERRSWGILSKWSIAWRYIVLTKEARSNVRSSLPLLKTSWVMYNAAYR